MSDSPIKAWICWAKVSIFSHVSSSLCTSIHRYPLQAAEEPLHHQVCR